MEPKDDDSLTKIDGLKTKEIRAYTLLGELGLEILIPSQYR